MAEQETNPEQLLAQALRAQAARAPRAPEPDGGRAMSGKLAVAPGPLPDRRTEPADEPTAVIAPIEPVATPHSYGLLSGPDAIPLATERAALDEPTPAKPVDTKQTRATGARSVGVLPTQWILLLAVLLGLASGAVIGLLTLL